MNPSDIDKVLWDYLASNSIVVLDPIANGRMNLISQLIKMGAVSSKISSVATIEDAYAEAIKNKAKIVFSDYMIGARSGLELLQSLKAEYEREGIKDFIFVLVTADASQSAVASAAEEDVDTYIIKPYSFNILHPLLATAVRTKLMPSRYLQLIEEGKEFMFRAEFDVALDCFQEATKESAVPTLAYFYLGQTEYMRQSLEASEKDYSKGLSYNRIHYKCMVGLYDLFMAQGKLHEAYDIVRKIAKFFPANPTRLASILRLAIATKNYQDVSEYYQIFLRLEKRTDALVKSICSALVVSGKYFLSQREEAKAMELFHGAGVSNAGNTGVLVYIIETLTATNLTEEAKPFRDRIRNLALGSVDEKLADYYLAFSTLPIADRIIASRKFIEQGIARLTIYENLAADLISQGQQAEYEKTLSEAMKKWPEEKERLDAFAEQQKRWIV